MPELKVGQTVRIYATVWDFCGELGNIALYIYEVGINTIPPIDPEVACQDVSGLTVEFKLAMSGITQCSNCTPETVYSTWGTGNTDSQGVAYIDHTVTEDDRAAYQEAAAKGESIRVLACIIGSKGQVVIKHRCSSLLTILPGAEPAYAVEFSVFENMTGILDLLNNYTGMLTAGINELIPGEAGWSIARTEIDRSNAVIRLYLSETGSWGINEIAVFLLTAAALAIAAICFLLFPTLLGIALGVAALVIATYGVVRLIDQVSVLKETVKNFETKDQNDTRLDQMIANVLKQYDESAKTKEDCLNKLNGLKISYVTYLDTMQKDFPNLYITAMKRSFEAAADDAVDQFRKGTMTCEQATEKILTQGGIAKSDVSTNFSTVYNINNPYQAPPKEDCWIKAPIGEGCLLSANTGMWIIGTIIAVAGLGITYWAVTRKPAETKIFIERAKEAVSAEAERVRAAYREFRAPPVPV